MENVTVEGEIGKKPTLVFTGEAPSPELEVEIMREGAGEIVKTGDTIVCDYLGQVWNGKVFDNSFDRGKPLDFPIGLGYVIKGWDQALVGQRVGSRVLMSIPAELGYGDRGVPQAGIKGGDTLVFVTDILGVE